MSEHQRRTVERHCDVCIIGGSETALAAALELSARGLAVIAVDADDQRAAEASAREQVRSHGGEILAGRAVKVAPLAGGAQRVGLTGGYAIVARHVLSPTTDPQTVGEIEHLAPAPQSANERDWEHRYGARQMWSGNPNGTLVREVSTLAPGTALDVGAGEGGDAIWLAEQGWRVVANDIAQPALDRIAAEATRRGLRLDYLRADANDPEPFGPPRRFDLVSAQYASIPRTPDGRGVRNLIDAVAPAGTLLVVSHDLAPMRTAIDTSRESRIFDPDAYVRVEDVAAALGDDPGWTIELHAQRPRPAGATSGHHVDDVVLRARRER